MKPENIILLAVAGFGIWYLMKEAEKKKEIELTPILFSDLPRRRGTVS